MRGRASLIRACRGIGAGSLRDVRRSVTIWKRGTSGTPGSSPCLFARIQRRTGQWRLIHHLRPSKVPLTAPVISKELWGDAQCAGQVSNQIFELFLVEDAAQIFRPPVPSVQSSSGRANSRFLPETFVCCP